MIELFVIRLQKVVTGIKIGHGVHSGHLMVSKTILCQAVLTAKGGLKGAHFMRYVASSFYLPTDFKICCHAVT